MEKIAFRSCFQLISLLFVLKNRFNSTLRINSSFSLKTWNFYILEESYLLLLLQLSNNKMGKEFSISLQLSNFQNIPEQEQKLNAKYMYYRKVDLGSDSFCCILGMCQLYWNNLYCFPDVFKMHSFFIFTLSHLVLNVECHYCFVWGSGVCFVGVFKLFFLFFLLIASTAMQ